jgi:hypothetical protein
VLYETRALPWGTDTRWYGSWDELASGVLDSLTIGARVLKQRRGNDGNGVWKVQAASPGTVNLSSPVHFQQALRGSEVETLPLADVLERCRSYFSGTNGMVDQAYQERLSDGMVRSYLVRDRVVGFGHHMVTALLPPEDGQSAPPDPPARIYYGAEQPEFQVLRERLETDWVAQMCVTLALRPSELPLIWDADFLLGPRDERGDDTYVLCEINVSSVFPIPDEAFRPLAVAAVESARAHRTL